MCYGRVFRAWEILAIVQLYNDLIGRVRVFTGNNAKLRVGYVYNTLHNCTHDIPGRHIINEVVRGYIGNVVLVFQG